jgi:hypothetical protein
MDVGTTSLLAGGESRFGFPVLVLVTELTSCRPGSGFKLAFSKAPTSLTLNIGSSVPVPVSARFGEDGEWVTLNMTAGANTVPLTSIGLLNPSKAKYPLVLDVVTQMENADGRLQLKSIELDSVRAFTEKFRSMWNTSLICSSGNPGCEAD